MTNVNLDKILFLKGQIYEAKAAIRNMKEELQAYTQLVTEFPNSALWKRAKDRITYIERFYFSIR